MPVLFMGHGNPLNALADHLTIQEVNLIGYFV